MPYRAVKPYCRVGLIGSSAALVAWGTHFSNRWRDERASVFRDCRKGMS